MVRLRFSNAYAAIHHNHANGDQRYKNGQRRCKFKIEAIKHALPEATINVPHPAFRLLGTQTREAIRRPLCDNFHGIRYRRWLLSKGIRPSAYLQLHSNTNIGESRSKAKGIICLQKRLFLNRFITSRSCRWILWEIPSDSSGSLADINHFASKTHRLVIGMRAMKTQIITRGAVSSIRFSDEEIPSDFGKQSTMCAA